MGVGISQTWPMLWNKPRRRSSLLIGGKRSIHMCLVGDGSVIHLYVLTLFIFPHVIPNMQNTREYSLRNVFGPH